MRLMTVPETGKEIHSERRRGDSVLVFLEGRTDPYLGAMLEDLRRRKASSVERRLSPGTLLAAYAAAADVRVRSGGVSVLHRAFSLSGARWRAGESRTPSQGDAVVIIWISCYGLPEYLVHGIPLSVRKNGRDEREQFPFRIGTDLVGEHLPRWTGLRDLLSF